jgi:hypothetical protein
MRYTLPKLERLPKELPLEDSVKIELQEGIPIFKATESVQNRIEELLYKQREKGLSSEEDEELRCYEELDEYLSFANRVMRNIILKSEEVVP